MTGSDPHLSSASPRFAGHRVLITGGGGFIGSALAERLVDSNQVTLYDQSFRNNAVALSRAWDHRSLRLVEGSVLDERRLAEATRGHDTVVHLAAVVGVNNVRARGLDTIETNFTGTRNLLRALDGRDGLHRFVYFSTSEVSGINAFRAGEESPATIGPVGEARWTYSIAKLAGEHLVYCYHRERQLPTVTIRPFNVFGRLRLGDHAMLRFIAAAQRGHPLEVHGDGAQIRSWCYIDDFVDALLRALERPAAVGQTFNIGNPRNTLTIYDLARRVVSQLDSSSEIVFRKIEFSDIDVRVPRMTKAFELLGFQPRFELAEAILATAEWYADHLPADRRPTDHLPADHLPAGRKPTDHLPADHEPTHADSPPPRPTD